MAAPKLCQLALEQAELQWAEVTLLAVQLGMDYTRLRKIQEECDDTNNRMLSAMDCWLKADPGACWMKIVNALVAIKKIVLAKQLKDKYCNTEASPLKEVKGSRILVVYSEV